MTERPFDILLSIFLAVLVVALAHLAWTTLPGYVLLGIGYVVVIAVCLGADRAGVRG